MRVKLSYNDMTLILGLLEDQLKSIETGIAGMKNEIREIEQEQNTCWEDNMYEDARMRHEELRNALVTDYKRADELKNLIEHMRKTR